MSDSNKAFFMRDVLESAITDKVQELSESDFANLVEFLFNCQCHATNHQNEFCVPFIDNCDELQPYIED